MATVGHEASAAAAADTRKAERTRRTSGRRSGMQLFLGSVLVAALPIAGATWILNANAVGNERSRSDSRLHGTLQAAAAEVDRASREADLRAEAVARSSSFQQALAAGDRATLRKIGKAGHVLVFLGSKALAPVPGDPSIVRSLTLRANGLPVGRVEALVPLDRSFALRLERAISPALREQLLIVRRGRVVLGPHAGARVRTLGHQVELQGVYRAATIRIPGTGAPTRLVALLPKATLDARLRGFQQRLLLAALGSLALLSLLAFSLGRPILRTLRDFRHVAWQAETDALTGVANRRSFDEELSAALGRAERLETPLCVILADLDGFKGINDRFGHQAGDDVLRRVGEILRAGVRQVDMPARYGGEEFAILLPGTGREGGVLLAERLREALAERPIDVIGGVKLPVTGSFGVAAYPSFPRDEIVAAADRSLYEAKRSGKNRVVAGEPSAS